MKVALYYPWIYLRSGGERTIAEILARSSHKWTVFTHRWDRRATFDSLQGAPIVELLPPISVRRNLWQAVKAAWRITAEKLPLEGFDALLVVCEGVGDFITVRNHQLPTFCLCLTPLRAAFDSYYRSGFLARNGSGVTQRIMFSLCACTFRRLDRLAWNNYSGISVISSEVRRRVLNGRLCDEKQIRLLHPGVDVSKCRASDVRAKDFFLPGRIMWTKNIELGIDAFKLLMSSWKGVADFTLTIAGFVDEKSKPYLAALRERASGEHRIRFVVSPTEEALFSKYAEAYAVLCTAFNEDWGLTSLEGMACEKAVVAVDRGGYRESVVHGETGFLVEPKAESFAEAMRFLADHPEVMEKMGEEGRKRSLLFTWDAFCGGLDRFLEQRPCALHNTSSELSINTVSE